MGRTLHPIDQLFQSAIGSYEETPSERVWDNIENKLDRLEAEKYHRKSNILGIIVAFLIVILLGVGIYEGFKIPEHKYNSAGNYVRQGTTIVNPPPITSPKVNISLARRMNFRSHVPKRKKPLSTIKPSAVVMYIHAISAKLPWAGKNHQAAIALINTHKIYGGKYVTVSSKLAEDSGALREKQVRDLGNEIADKRNKDNINLPFSIRLITGLDWSTVKFKQWTVPSLDAGFKVTYRFASSWNVETGLFVTDKNFKSPLGNFKPVNTFPDNDLDEVTADLKVINLPVNISYSVWNRQRNQFAVSLGVSSYWLLTEEYTYHYKRNSGRSDEHWELENMNKNILSIINVSVDYEHYFNRKLSLFIEPYFQLPVSKIGYGRVSLQGTGIHLGAGYHF